MDKELEQKINQSLHWTGWKETYNSYKEGGQVMFLAQLSKHNYRDGKLNDKPKACYHCWEAVAYYQHVDVGRELLPGRTFSGLDVFNTESGKDNKLDKKESLEKAKETILKEVMPMLESGKWIETDKDITYRFANWRPLSSPDMKRPWLDN